MNGVNRQLKRIAKVLGKEEPPEVKEKTLKIFLKHLRKNIEVPCTLTGSEDFEWEEFYPPSQKATGLPVDECEKGNPSKL